VSKLILTVDDSASMRMLLKTSLTAQGFRIESANDGEHGLERMHEVQPDLLITDINMPKMDGFELIEAVRALKASSAARRSWCSRPNSRTRRRPAPARPALPAGSPSPSKPRSWGRRSAACARERRI
jgi:CheY-like chemotaxis protein